MRDYLSKSVAATDSTGLPDLPPPPPTAISGDHGFATILGDRDSLSSSDFEAPPGYEIIRRLGCGAMGEVFLANQIRLRRLVALKMIRTGSSEQRLKRQLVVEAEAIARLQHPNIVQVFEVGESTLGPYLVLELVEGGSLDKHLARAPLAPLRAAELIETLARAAHHAHERGLVHRDLKPGNVLLSFSEDHSVHDRQGVNGREVAPSVVPKISDFGLVYDVHSGGGVGVAGTPSYMAPEQTEYQVQASPRIDIYALGAILYECLTGRPPFAEPTPAETLAAIRNRELIPIRQLKSAVPRDLATICEKCLHKDPARRYDTAQALAHDLERFRCYEPISARPVSRTERALKWARRRPIVAGLSALSGLAIIALMIGGATYQALLRDANRTAIRHQARAENNYRKALAAVERLLTRVGEERLVKIPEMDGVRADLLKDALEFYQGFLRNAEDPDPDIRWETALAFARVARIQQYLGRSDDAAEHFQQAISRADSLTREFPSRDEYRYGLADAHRQYAQLLSRWSSSEKAGDHFDKARRIWSGMESRNPGNREYLALVASCDHLESIWHKDSGRMAEAEALCRNALVVRQSLATGPKADDESRRDLGMTLHNLANILSTTNRLRDAEKYEAEAVALFEMAAGSQPTDEDVRSLLSAGYHNLGVISSWSGRHDDARRHHKQALKLREELARAHPTVPHIQAGVAQSCQCLGAVELETGHAADAESYTKKAVSLQERLYRERPHDGFGAESLLNSQTNLALVYQSTKRPDDAASVYAQALEVAERLIKDHPDNLNYQSSLAALCLNRGNLDKDRKHAKDALPWYDRAIQAADAALAKDGRLKEAQRWRRFAYGSRALAYEQLQDYSAALRDWDVILDASPAEEQTTVRLWRTIALAQTGQCERLIADVELLAPLMTDSPSLQHLMECCLAAARKSAANKRLSTVLLRQSAFLFVRAEIIADIKGRCKLLTSVWHNEDLRMLIQGR